MNRSALLAGRALLPALLVALTALSTVRAAPVPLRQLDWNATLLADPRVGLIEDCPPLPFAQLGPCIEVVADEQPFHGSFAGEPPVPAISGYAATVRGDVGYGDLDGDGREEALIRVESGGTAGTIGFLLYREGELRPELVTVMPGYKVFPRIEDRYLVVTQPFYFGFEGNCCPTAALKTTYGLANDRLAVMDTPELAPVWLILGERERVASFEEVTVAGFYRALASRRYDEAYAFLSSAFQAANPFPAWQAGFATTVNVEVETRHGATFTDEAGRRVVEVLVSLVVEDELPSGGTVRSRFAGSWFLIGGPEFLLDRAEIRREE